jgi:hypothetical protein
MLDVQVVGGESPVDRLAQLAADPGVDQDLGADRHPVGLGVEAVADELPVLERVERPGHDDLAFG